MSSNLIRRVSRYVTLFHKCYAGASFSDKKLACMLVLNATLDPRKRRILSSLTKRINARARDGQVRLTLNRFGEKLVFCMRKGNSADYNIGSELVMQEYDFSHDAKFPYIVDGGANIGMFSIQAAKVNPDSKIIAYEPNPDNIAQLQLNLNENGLEVEIRERALWSSDTELFFEADTSMSGTVGENVTGVRVAAEAPVLKENMWLKIDIEGAEYEVIPVVLESDHLPLRIDMEIHEHDQRGKELCDLLSSAGYSVSGDIESSSPCIFVKALLSQMAID